MSDCKEYVFVKCAYCGEDKQIRKDQYQHYMKWGKTTFYHKQCYRKVAAEEGNGWCSYERGSGFKRTNSGAGFI